MLSREQSRARSRGMVECRSAASALRKASKIVSKRRSTSFPVVAVKNGCCSGRGVTLLYGGLVAGAGEVAVPAPFGGGIAPDQAVVITATVRTVRRDSFRICRLPVPCRRQPDGDDFDFETVELLSGWPPLTPRPEVRAGRPVPFRWGTLRPAPREGIRPAWPRSPPAGFRRIRPFGPV